MIIVKYSTVKNLKWTEIKDLTRDEVGAIARDSLRDISTMLVCIRDNNGHHITYNGNIYMTGLQEYFENDTHESETEGWRPIRELMFGPNRKVTPIEELDNNILTNK